ncbi:MAG: ATP-binding cassette domain-containing protein [Oligoflexia bacterium]|nr:ATP-binding cassette domain-containing protein [Oligoflexia bacterium]
MIEINALYKSFGHLLAVNNLEFKVDKGEVLGLLGPNGAGKSTTMRMITGLINPDSGSIFVNGLDMRNSPREIKSIIGYVPENAPSYGEMSVREFLHFCAEVRGMGITKAKNEIAEKIEKIAESCSLQLVLDQIIETLSKGYRRRVSLAQALIHDPPILILDEPTDGLDPNQKHEIRTLIKKIASDKCIIISTHILEEVEAVCSRVIIISLGKLLFNGTPTEFRNKSATGRMDDVFRAITTEEVVEGVNLL